MSGTGCQQKDAASANVRCGTPLTCILVNQWPADRLMKFMQQYQRPWYQLNLAGNVGCIA